jgi:hypothetical protein
LAFSPFAKRLIYFGALAVVLIGGAVYFFDRSDTASPSTPTAGADAPAKAARRMAAQPPTTAAATANAEEPAVPNEAQSDLAARLIGEARRLAGNGKFTEATAKLDQADKAVPDMAETAQARRDIAQLSTPEGQLATQLERARLAISQDDAAAANTALAEVEKLNPQAPEIAQLRQALQAAQQKEAHRNSHITELLTTMREAIARHDFAAADGALNEAARIDVRDPAIDQARIELARAHDADRKEKAEK